METYKEHITLSPDMNEERLNKLRDKQIDTRPSEEEFKKVISNYLSWKINEILKNE